MTDFFALQIGDAFLRVPEELRADVSRRIDAVHAAVSALPYRESDRWAETIPYVFACSEFVARQCERAPSMLVELITSRDLLRAYAHGELESKLDVVLRGVSDESDLKIRLRQFRNREMVRIAWRDISGWADLNETMTVLSGLADACVEAALGFLLARAREHHGTPRAESDRRECTFVVLGLGKLGASELNFSSDIDLIFCYTADGETDHPAAVSNHEFFIRLGQALITTLNESTAEGFVFRVDMRLRPNGQSGPLALSFDAMEHYYQTHGREWERYALIKARVVAGDQPAGTELLARLKPFIFRRYLDYGMLEGLRTMKVLIEREIERKGVHNNIKLGAGGIREIEFIGQALQLIRGGREPELQAREILTVLARLATGGHLTAQAMLELTAAYVFLRNVEHRLQMANDRQTHVLPVEPLEQRRLALAMGYASWDLFSHELVRHRRKVQEHFSMVFVAPQGEERAQEASGLVGVWLKTLDAPAVERVLANAGYQDAGAVVDLLRGLREGSAYSAFSTEGRSRMDRLVPLLLAAAGLAPAPDATLARLIQLVEAIGRRSVYLALLIENPMALSQLVKLCAASPWIANWIAQHPILLDELIDPHGLYNFSSREQLATELNERIKQFAVGDTETQMDALREFRHGYVLRVAAADIGPGLAPELVGERLADIAEVVVGEALQIVDDTLRRVHGEPRCDTREPGFALIAYGKLGSRELGYASDLDVIFLYEGCADGGATAGPRSISNEQYFGRIAQRLIHFLTTRTAAGVLYEVDTRLRPSGRKGTMVAEIEAFRRYQRESAWTWEHQALVRARPIAGSRALREAFAAIRQEILCLPRDSAKLAVDVRDMRQRMIETHGSREAAAFDVKQDRGGIVDIEFMVQYWVLRWAAEHPALTRHTDNLSILNALVDAGLLEAPRREVLVTAYRRYLAIAHKLKLMEQGERVAREELGDLPTQIEGIWHDVLGKE